MKRYNLTVVLHAGVAVNATSAEAAKQAIQKTLEGAIQLVDLPEFVVTDTEITGIFDVDWNEIEEATP